MNSSPPEPDARTPATCSARREQLSAVHDRELEADAELLAHVEECPKCRWFQAELEALAPHFSSLAEMAPPAQFLERVTAEIARRSESPRRPLLALTRVWAPRAAASLIGFLSVALASSPGPVGDRTTPADPVASIVERLHRVGRAVHPDGGLGSSVERGYLDHLAALMGTLR